MHVQNFIGLLALVARGPEPPAVGVDGAAYASYVATCRESRAECVALLKAVVKEVGSEALLGAKERTLDAAKLGVESVASWVDGACDIGQKLVVEGVAYARKPVSPVVPSLPRGKHYEKNKEKRERKKKHGSSGASDVGSPQPVGGCSDEDLRRSYNRRREAENKLAACRAEAKLRYEEDEAYVAMQMDAHRSQLVKKASDAALRSQKSLSQLEEVSPGSSASMYEYNVAVRKLRMAEDHLTEYRAMARKMAVDVGAEADFEKLDRELTMEASKACLFGDVLENPGAAGSFCKISGFAAGEQPGYDNEDFGY